MYCDDLLDNLFGMAPNTDFRMKDWCKLFDEIENKNAISILMRVLSGLYEIGSELVRTQKENHELKHQLENTRCGELKKTIEEKNLLLEALGSSVVKLEENRNVDNFVQEAYRIFSNDSLILTPPPDLNKSASNATPPSNTKNTSQKCSKQVHTPTQIDRTDPLNLNKEDVKQQNDVKLIEVKVEENDSLEKKVINMNNSSDISITDESVSEMHLTPKGRTSPIIGISKTKNKTLPRGVLSFQMSGAQKAKIRLSKRKNGLKSLKQTTLSLTKPTRTVNLSDLIEFGGGVRNSEIFPTPKASAIQALIEDDDIIQPSPTSENITTTFHSKLNLGPLPQSRTACGVTSPPPPPSTPPAMPPPSCHMLSQNGTDALTATIEFDELMETDSLDASMDLLQRHRDMSQTCFSPVLCEIINTSKKKNIPENKDNAPVKKDSTPVKKDKTPVKKKDKTSVKKDKTPVKKNNTPVKKDKTPVKVPAAVDFDTDISVSVLRQPFPRRRAETENVAPKEEKASGYRTPHATKNKQIKKESLLKKSPEECSERGAGDSMSLLKNYQGNVEVVDKKINLRKNSAPIKSAAEEPAFQYKEKTVRKKADKLKLPGWSCDDCKNYYADVSDPARLALLMERCSRHRAARNPARARTPPGFWNNHFTVPEDTEQLNRLNNAI